MTIAQQLTDLNQCKQDIKAAIEAKGVTVGTVPFNQYDEKIALISGGGAVEPQPTAWVRPSEWSALPTLNPTDQKITFLVAVFPPPLTNFIGFTIWDLSNTLIFDVDWGDGTVQTGLSSATTPASASYTYDYNNANLTSTSYGYKVATVLVSVTDPITRLTNFSFRRSGTPERRTNNVLDFAIASPYLNTFKILYANTEYQNMLERVRIISSSNSITGTDMFRNCTNLQKVELPSNLVLTNPIYMFANCYRIQEIPAVNINLGTSGNLDYMCNACYELIKVGTITVTAGNNTRSASYMFFNCYSLYRAPDFSTQYFAATSSMFQGDRSLQIVPNYNLSNTTSITGMFNSCTTLTTAPNLTLNTTTSFTANALFNNCPLTTAPAYNLSKCTDASSMFSGCEFLTTPDYNLSLATTISSMFSNNRNLMSVGNLTTTSGTLTSATTVFSNCVNLKTLPVFTTTTVTAFGSTTSNIINSCTGIREIGAFNCNAITNSTNQFQFTNCPELSRSQVTNVRFTHSYANCSLSATALNEIYTNLPTVTGQTITVTGNYGTTSDDPTIATGKGWTVTG